MPIRLSPEPMKFKIRQYANKLFDLVPFDLITEFNNTRSRGEHLTQIMENADIIFETTKRDISE